LFQPQDETISFDKLALSDALKANLETLGYHDMTAVQAQCLPAALEGRDVVGQSKTGSGKTAVFGLGILQSLSPEHFTPQALVICPTRELADQVAGEIRRLARALSNIKVVTLCGGAPVRRQLDSLQNGVHIIVGTPGRIEDHLRRESLQTDQLKTLVLDEADRMLDMGFRDTLNAIISQLPAPRQTLLFSATFADETQQIAKRITRDPVWIRADTDHDHTTIEQHFYQIDEQHRQTALAQLLKRAPGATTLVFCTTRNETRDVARALAESGFAALPLHGEMDQRDRDQTLVRFSNQSASILVATDVAARGLDIDSLDVVINYQPANDSDTHVHRVGRTGRAGDSGVAYTLISDKQKHKLGALEAALGAPAAIESLKVNMHDPHRGVPARMVTLLINGGKKQKLRAGDILGALTSKGGIDAAHVGKINLFANHAYVAIERRCVSAALDKIRNGKMKGRSFKVRSLP
jgi:ATP-independent RNA helicase DbpA